MFRRSALGALSAAALSLLLTLPVLAGGWATVTLDRPISELQTDQSYDIGYTVLQHGVTPVRDATTSIHARLTSDLTYQVFPARAEGKPGHYVATVILPTAGHWTWEVDPHPFPIQPLGSLSVTAPTSASAATTASLLEPRTVATLVATSLVLTLAVPTWTHWRQRGVTQSRSPASPGGGPVRS